MRLFQAKRAQAIYAAKKINSEIAIVATLTSSQTPNYNEIFNCIDFSSIDVFGVNCSYGPHFVLKSLEAFTQKVSNYLIAQPNAGLPREVDGRKIYMCTPEYMAQFAQDCLQLGVKIVEDVAELLQIILKLWQMPCVTLRIK